MTDYLKQLVNHSHNFRFLTRTHPLLAETAAAAESYAIDNPVAASILARLFGETLAKELAQRATPPVRWTNFGPAVTALVRLGVVSSQVETHFDVVRRTGNDAAHDNVSTLAKAMSSVKSCFALGVWWHRLITGQDVPHTFTPPAKRDTPAAAAVLEEIENRIAELQKAFEARRPEIRIRIAPAPPGPRDWTGGSKVNCASAGYLVHDGVEKVSPAAHDWSFTRADGHALGARAASVRLCDFAAQQADAHAKLMIDGMRSQAVFLAADRPGRYPGLVGQQQSRGRFTLVTSVQPGPTWTEAFGTGSEPLDSLLVPRALDVLTSVATALADLHRAGAAHRLLDGGEIVLPARGRGGCARDLGLAWLPRIPGEGGTYPAPEQRAIARGRLGPAVDVFQLASLLQHTCSGVAPATGRAIPLRMFHPALPERLDETLTRALDTDPARRPGMVAFAAELRSSRSAMLREATA